MAAGIEARERDKWRKRVYYCSCFRKGGIKLLIGEILRLVCSQGARIVNKTIHWQMKIRLK